MQGRRRCDLASWPPKACLAPPRICARITPNDADLVQRTLLDLGPIIVSPGEPIEQIVLPDAWFRQESTLRRSADRDRQAGSTYVWQRHLVIEAEVAQVRLTEHDV